VKEKLLQALDQGREREAALEALVVDAPANADGRWNAKDHLAHLAWDRRRGAQLLDAVRTGGEPPPSNTDGDVVQNAIVYAEIKDWSAAHVKAEAARSWAALRQAIEASSERNLAEPHPHRPESQVWEAVPASIAHVGTHVWSCCLDAGEEERVLEIARWSADVEGRFFTTPEKLADSRYNLACAYARLGMAEEALSLLRASFETKPELAVLARQDSDLDRIREELAPILL
jgi:tetratricopeptide (TPR) repeat protein